MIRILLGLLAVAFVAAIALAATGDAGQASVSWLGWRIDTSASAGIVALVLGALAATLFWQMLLWLLAAPDRAARARAETRRREGAEPGPRLCRRGRRRGRRRPSPGPEGGRLCR